MNQNVKKGIIAVAGGTIGAALAIVAADKISEYKTEHERQPGETLDDIADMTDEAEPVDPDPNDFVPSKTTRDADADTVI